VAALGRLALHVPAGQALDALVLEPGDGVVWTVWGDAVLFTLSELAAR